MRFQRIDAFDMSFEECAVARKYKLSSTGGMGEKRIYVGHDEKSLDEFFDLDHIDSFLFVKDDLIKYLVEAKEEFINPVQEYSEDISKYYDQNVADTKAIAEDIIYLHFTKKYDSQNRYYLNFKDKESSKKWDYIRNIALPRVTKFSFLKIANLNTGKLHIYIKPSFFLDEKEVEEKIVIENLVIGDKQSADNIRKGQVKWRNSLLELNPSCVITKVSDDRILEACHIKPYKVSLNEGKENETIDVDNGLIMTPTYHKLFDLGFISFKDDGTLLVSPFLSNFNKKRLGLDGDAHYVIRKGCSKYLAYHRENIFNVVPDLNLI